MELISKIVVQEIFKLKSTEDLVLLLNHIKERGDIPDYHVTQYNKAFNKLQRGINVRAIIDYELLGLGCIDFRFTDEDKPKKTISTMEVEIIPLKIKTK